MAPLDLALHHERLDRAEAELLGRLAQPVRVRIMHLVDSQGVTAKQVAASLGIDIQEATDHLEALREVGLLAPIGMFGERYRPTSGDIIAVLLRLRQTAAEAMDHPHTR